MAHPKCFISYSWDSDDHKDWVRRLAAELQRKGVVTYLDQWDVHPGMDLTKYMESCIRESDFVLLVCTPIFAQKANTGRGGVGYEKSIVTGEIFEGAASPKKFVPLLRKGSPRDSLPSYLKSRAYIDFRNDNMLDPSLETLLRHLYQAPKYVRPLLGSKPDLPTQGSEQPAVITPPAKQPKRVTFEEVYRFAYSPGGINKSYEGAEAFARKWMKQFADKDFEVFKQVYQFAYIPGGINKSHEGAEAFARKWMEQFADKDFEVFKQVYQFAYIPGGINKSHEGAEAFARKWMEQFADKDFEVFKQVYQFAYIPGGINKSHEGAEAFARKWMEQFADKDFEVFKQVYQFAYIPDGMNKSHEGAEAFALEQLSKR